MKCRAVAVASATLVLTQSLVLALLASPEDGSVRNVATRSARRTGIPPTFAFANSYRDGAVGGEGGARRSRSGKSELSSKLSPKNLHSRSGCHNRALLVAGGGGGTLSDKGDAGQQGMGIGGSIFNLVKNVVGSGVLALPGGVAAFTHSKKAVGPILAMTAALGMLSAYCFSLLGRLSSEYDARSVGELWGKTVGEKTQWLPATSVIIKTVFSSLAYSIIIGDIYANLAATLGLSGLLALRSVGLILITVGVLLPLCLMKDLSGLAFTSKLGVTGTAFTAGVMIKRLLDGTYAPGGKFFASVPAGTFGGSFSLSPLSLILVSMLSTGFIAHYNAPKFYNELKDRSIPRFNVVVGASYAVAMALYALMMTFPFLTFGGACQSSILNNYAVNDGLITLARLGIASSVIFGYPLTFLVTREGAFDALGVKAPSNKQHTALTVGLLGVFTAVACVLRDLGFVIAFGGAVLGSSIIYIFPSVMWLSKCRKGTKSGKQLPPMQKAEYYANYGLVGLGFLLGVVGGGVSLLKSFVWK